jgi:uncharacterized sulfatase
MKMIEKFPRHVSFLMFLWVLFPVCLAEGRQTTEAVVPVAPKAPNIVLIAGDDQGWTDFGFMGHPEIRTPCLDQLASESLTFRRGYVPSSLCCPSLASLISGLYPHQHGIVGNDPAIPADLFPQAESEGRTAGHLRSGGLVQQLRYDWLQQMDRVPCLPEILGEERNYLSFQSGKWWLGHFRNAGFTHGMTEGDPQRGGRHGDAGLLIGREGIEPIRNFLDIAQRSERPFLLYYAPMMPHTPHNPPQRLLDYYRTKTPHLPIAKYWAMCEWFDETVGELMGELDRRQLDENTIVVFVTDNGWINRPDASQYAPRSKRSPFDGGLRTPLMIRWKGRVAPLMDDRHLASSIDIVPTLLAAAGIRRESASGIPGQGGDFRYPGINLLDSQAVAGRERIYGEVFEHDVRDIADPASSVRYRWLIGADWKLIVPSVENGVAEAEQLYDLGSDPFERENRMETNPEIARELRETMNGIWNPVSPKKPALPGSGESRRPPNILFFLSDDQRNDALSCSGNAIVRTPMIDALAARGVRFENAFVTTSICAASRASFLTGAWERSHQYTFGTPPLDDRWVTASYPARLRQQGWHTGLVGKFGVNVNAGAAKQMFDDFQPLSQPYWKIAADGSRKHLTDICGDRAIGFLNGCDKKTPFCLSVWFNAVHAQDGDREDHYPTPPDEIGLYENLEIPPPKVAVDYFESLPDWFQNSMNRQRWYWRWDTPEKYQRNMKAYYRLVSGMDRNVGRIVRHLRRLNLDTNTVIIFCSDNGYYQGSRGFAGKWTHFDESLRIPLIVYDPRADRTKRGTLRTEMVLNVDVPATILDLARANQVVSDGKQENDRAGSTEQLETIARCQGNSLSGLVDGRPDPDWRTDFFCEHLFDNASIPKWEGVRTERYKYARYFEQSSGSEFLYDLQNDPDELVNLVASPEFAPVLDGLRSRCDELRTLKQDARFPKQE